MQNGIPFNFRLESMDLALERLYDLEDLLCGDVASAVEGVDWELRLFVWVAFYAVHAELVELLTAAGLALGVF